MGREQIIISLFGKGKHTIFVKLFHLIKQKHRYNYFGSPEGQTPNNQFTFKCPISAKCTRNQLGLYMIYIHSATRLMKIKTACLSTAMLSCGYINHRKFMPFADLQVYCKENVVTEIIPDFLSTAAFALVRFPC